MQSGKPVGVFRTTPDAPRVLIANSNLVPASGRPGRSSASSSAPGLMMYGQMTAGSWIYIGTQGILQGTYETFAAGRPPALRRRRSRARVTLTAGPRRHGRRPAARRDHERRRRASCVEVDPTRARRRLDAGYLDELSADLDAALAARATPGAPSARRASIGAGRQRRRGAARRWSPRRHARPRHRPDLGARPARRLRARAGMSLADAGAAPRERPRRLRAPRRSPRWPTHVRAMLDLPEPRARSSSTTATTCAPGALEAGRRADAFDFPGFVPAYIRPLFCEGKGPFRWVALSGDPADIAVTDARPGRAVPRGRVAAALARAGRASRCRSRACRRASAGSATASATGPGCASTSWCASGEVKAPIVIGRDHLDCGSVAVAQPRDRGHAGRLRRHRRLADPQRAGQHRRRRDLGAASTTAAASASATRCTPAW